MIVRIIVYANKEGFSAKLVSGNYSKKIGGELERSTSMKNTLIGLIKAIKKIKYPVDIEIVNNKKSIKNVIKEGLDSQLSHSYINDNIDEWKEFVFLIQKHESVSFFLHKENERNLKEFQSLYNDCVNKNYIQEI